MKLRKQEGKYMATVRVGDKGQIVIPKDARDMFQIQPGDTLVLLADVKRGIALVRYDKCSKMFSDILGTPDDGDAEP